MALEQARRMAGDQRSRSRRGNPVKPSQARCCATIPTSWCAQGRSSAPTSRAGDSPRTEVLRIPPIARACSSIWTRLGVLHARSRGGRRLGSRDRQAGKRDQARAIRRGREARRAGLIPPRETSRALWGPRESARYALDRVVPGRQIELQIGLPRYQRPGEHRKEDQSQGCIRMHGMRTSKRAHRDPSCGPAAITVQPLTCTACAVRVAARAHRALAPVRADCKNSLLLSHLETALGGPEKTFGRSLTRGAETLLSALPKARDPARIRDSSGGASGLARRS